MGNFSLESHETCNYDKLEIYDGRKSELNKIGKYCGTQVSEISFRNQNQNGVDCLKEL